MSDASSAAVRLEIREHVAYLTMTRADAANTMNLQFGREFVAAASAVRKDSNVRAVLLRGEGKNFCFGGDLRGMMAAGGNVNAYLTELTTDLHAGLMHLARANAPVVAAVQGTAAGAGLGLVLAADLAIAGKSAKFTAAYTAIGLTPDAGSTFLLPRAVGYKRAMEMFITNRVLDAQLALEWGLVNQIVEDPQLADTAAALAARLAAGPAGAFGAVKRLLAEAEPGWEAQLAREGRIIAGLAETTEGREGIAAFLEKRTPKFT
jgi:2-(1,2-epoxy-1,2-dihydrophenyl)acetyl-CoA isomerase